MSQKPEKRIADLSLIQAAEQGDHAWVDELISQGVDVNSRSPSGMSALMGAATNGHHRVVKHLLELGADPGARRLDGLDALALAVFFGHTEVVKELIANGADPTARTRFGTTLDSWATARGFPQVAQILRNAEPAQALTVAALASEQISGSRSNNAATEITFDTSRNRSRTAETEQASLLIRSLVYITADWQRLTLLTLILMLGCGLATFAFLKMDSYEQEVTPANGLLPLSFDSRPSNSQRNPESIPPSEKPQSPPASSLALESPIGKQARLEINARGEISSLVPARKSKRETRVEATESISQEAKPSLTSENEPASGSGSKSATDLAGQAEQNAVGSELSLETPPLSERGKLETQRLGQVPPAPTPLPAGTPARKPKSKVIQWP